MDFPKRTWMDFPFGIPQISTPQNSHCVRDYHQGIGEQKVQQSGFRVCSLAFFEDNAMKRRNRILIQVEFIKTKNGRQSRYV
jgi:hypothetical protein